MQGIMEREEEVVPGAALRGAPARGDGTFSEELFRGQARRCVVPALAAGGYTSCVMI